MPSKNDLSALKSAAQTPILPPEHPEPARTATRKLGRPAKQQEAKRSKRVQLSLTEQEAAIIAEKAGLAGSATYLYDVLRKAGAFE
jgi:hypothetical protein